MKTEDSNIVNLKTHLEEKAVSKRLTLSIVFPNYNHARFLPKQLQSMLNQSFQPLEIIIIDDASTDNSVEVIREFIRKAPYIRLFCNNKNLGVEHNINRLIEMASGDYIFLSAADDLILPGFFEKSMRLLTQNPEAGLCSAMVRLIGENGEDRGIRAMPVVSNKPCFLSPDKVQYNLCKYGRWVTISSMIMKRSAVIQEGGQQEGLGSFADNFLALIIALKHGVCFIPEPLGCWRQLATGHGSKLNNDWEGLLNQGIFVVNLMRTTYRELFKDEYIVQFEKHWMYMVGMTTEKLIHLERERSMTRIIESLQYKQTVLRHGGRPNLLWFSRLQAQVWKFYVVLRFAPWRWWINGRLSILINYRKLVIREKLNV